MLTAIGMVELSSIAAGFETEDAMLKAAGVELILARTICSGKFLVIIAGDVAAVKASLDTGEAIATGFLIEKLLIPNVDSRVFAAISNSVVLPEDTDHALGILETFSISSIIEAADTAVKAADVILLRVHVAMAVGGKGFLLVCGDVASVNAAISAAKERIKEQGMLVNSVVIPRAAKELFSEYI
ncbi:BMC domain-containing protein [Candidatus Riflebacteria bacterium]